MSTNIQKVKNSMMEAPLVGATGYTGATGAFTTVAGSVSTILEGDNTTRNFTIDGFNGTNPDGYIVSVSGIDQLPSVNFTVAAHPTLSGKGVITFSSPPSNLEKIAVRSLLGGLINAPAEYTGLLNPSVREKVSFTATGTDQPGFAKGEMLLNLNSAQIFFLQGTSSDYSINVTLPSTFNTTETVSFTVVLKSYASTGTKMLTAFKIAGTANSPYWALGAPTAGSAAGIDIFNFTILKNIDSSYTAFASRTNFTQ